MGITLDHIVREGGLRDKRWLVHQQPERDRLAEVPSMERLTGGLVKYAIFDSETT